MEFFVKKYHPLRLYYIVNHTARVYLVDTDGTLRLSHGFQTPVENIVHNLDLLLK